MHQSQFHAQRNETEEQGFDEMYEKGNKLIHYHKIRWTSYNECVQRVSMLYDSLQTYLLNASEDMANAISARRRCTDLHERFTNHQFILYLLFLKDSLPILAVANKCCQERGKLIHESYGQILAVVKTMAEPIVIDNSLIESDLLSENNLHSLSVVNYGEEGFVKLPGEDFNKYWKEVEDNAL